MTWIKHIKPATTDSSTVLYTILAASSQSLANPVEMMVTTMKILIISSTSTISWEAQRVTSMNNSSSLNSCIPGLTFCRYVILDVLGAGTFGQVVKCRNIKTQEIVAVKIVKNKMAYFKQSMMEVAILEMASDHLEIASSSHVKQRLNVNSFS